MEQMLLRCLRVKWWDNEKLFSLKTIQIVGFMMKIILQQKKMINIDNYTNEKKTQHRENWPYIPDQPYKILIIGGSGSGKANALIKLINNQPYIDKIYFYA